MDLIDLTVDTQFHHSTWIGTGKEFSNSLPQAVYDKKREILRVPNLFPTQLPTSVTLVREFIHHPLPSQSSGLSFHQTTEWFSSSMPLTSPTVLLARPVPSEKVLKKLNKAIGQMWFDGASSIVDPRFNNGAERFPLWVLSLWNDMQKVVGDQKRWQSSVRWLELATHPKDIVAQVKHLIKRLPWNKPLRSTGATTLEFAGFLGVSWLLDTQINLMVNVLQNRMKTEEHTKGVLIEPLTLSWELISVGKGWTEPLTSSYLSRLANQVQAGITTIWFPINVNNNHWIVGRVDFKNHTFTFGELQPHMMRDEKNLLVLGDSMVMSGVAPPPDEVLKGLRKWFNERFGWKLMNMGNTLKRPHQTDTYSCSICAMSTIAHGVFGDTLWQQHNASTHRIGWLLEIRKHNEFDDPVEPVSVLNSRESHVVYLHLTYVGRHTIVWHQHSTHGQTPRQWWGDRWGQGTPYK